MTTDGSSPFDDVSAERSDRPAPADNPAVPHLGTTPRRRRRPPTDPPEPPFVTQAGQVPPVRPPDPISPFIRPPWARRRQREWPILIVAMVFAAVVMVVCCLAGLATYTSYGPLFR